MICSILASLPGTAAAHQLVVSIRQKCTPEEVLGVLKDLPNPRSEEESDSRFNPLKIDVFVQTLLNLGSKSFSHSFAAISKFLYVFKVDSHVVSEVFVTQKIVDLGRIGGGPNMRPEEHVRVVAQPPADDGRAGGQDVENTDRRMFGGCELDIFQRNVRRVHKDVLVGDLASHY